MDRIDPLGDGVRTRRHYAHAIAGAERRRACLPSDGSCDYPNYLPRPPPPPPPTADQEAAETKASWLAPLDTSGELQLPLVKKAPPPERMPCPVALCLVGFVRTLPYTYANLAWWSGFQHQCIDVYGAVGVDGEEDTAKGQWRAISKQSIATAIAALNPINWTDAPLRDVPRVRPDAVHAAIRRRAVRADDRARGGGRGGVKYTGDQDASGCDDRQPADQLHAVQTRSRLRRQQIPRRAHLHPARPPQPVRGRAGLEHAGAVQRLGGHPLARLVLGIRKRPVRKFAVHGGAPDFGGRSWKGYQETGMCVRRSARWSRCRRRCS